MVRKSQTVLFDNKIRCYYDGFESINRALSFRFMFRKYLIVFRPTVVNSMESTGFICFHDEPVKLSLFIANSF